MQVFDLISKPCLISDQNPLDLYLSVHWVSRFMYLTQISLIYWLLPL